MSSETVELLDSARETAQCALHRFLNKNYKDLSKYEDDLEQVADITAWECTKHWNGNTNFKDYVSITTRNRLVDAIRKLRQNTRSAAGKNTRMHNVGLDFMSKNPNYCRDDNRYETQQFEIREEIDACLAAINTKTHIGRKIKRVMDLFFRGNSKEKIKVEMKKSGKEICYLFDCGVAEIRAKRKRHL